MPPTRVLVLGIDAANPELLLRWAEDGFLPNIRSLLTRGLVGETRSVDGFFVGSTWPSFYTGVTPARHGVHYEVQLKPGTYEFHRPASGEFVKCAPFWSHLSRAGRRVAILDVPLCRLDPSVHGMHVVEWGSHDALYGFQAWPPEAAKEIRSRFGEHPLGATCDAVRSSPQEYAAFIDTLLRGVRTKARLTRHFLALGGWDFFMQVFTEAHCVGHQCWHLHDAAHPGHDPSISSVTGDPLRRVYAAIDAAVGEVLGDAGDAFVVVLVAHGMSHWYGAQFLLNEILFRLGVAHPPVAPPPRAGVVPAVLSGARQVWRRLPDSIRDRLTPLRRRLAQDGGGPPALGVDPRVSRCFPLNNGLAVGGIRLNQAGREPMGVLEPGRATDEFCDSLSKALSEIEDERTGRPLVRRVLRTANLYAGEYLDDLPDLLVEWSDESPTGSSLIRNGAGALVRARSPKIGVVEGINHYGRTGEHRPEGLFIAAGPGVGPGRLGRVASILDFAPTFAGFFGVTLPQADGKALPELLHGEDGRG